MKKIPRFIFTVVVLFVAAGCQVAKTSASAPNTTQIDSKPPDADTAWETYNDGTRSLRRRQANADIRAREQRNNWWGNPERRADRDLESEVRSKLEVNLPASLLTVDAEAGVVTIAGTVPTSAQFERIEPLAKEIKGVKTVKVNATVAPAVSEQNP